MNKRTKINCSRNKPRLAYVEVHYYGRKKIGKEKKNKNEREKSSGENCMIQEAQTEVYLQFWLQCIYKSADFSKILSSLTIKFQTLVDASCEIIIVN